MILISQRSKRISRRAILAGGLASLAAARAGAQTPSPAPASQQPLTLVARAETVRLRAEPKPPTPALTYNGQQPGPLTRVAQGAEVSLRLENRLEEATSLHFRGVRNAAAMDGVAALSQPPIAPGQSRDIRFIARDAGTFFYQPCLQGRTSFQSERGLYGLLIVDERNPPVVDKDVPVVIDDWRLDDAGGVAIPAPTTGQIPRLGNLLTINGAPKAAEDKLPVGGRARIRLVNASVTAIMVLRFEGPPATVVAIDGQPSSTAFQPKRAAAILTPGGRMDVMVDLAGEAGQEFRVLAQLSEDVAVPALVLKSEGARRPALPAIAALPGNDLPEKIDLARAQRATLTIEGGPIAGGAASPWRLNGQRDGVAAAKPLFTAKRGATVVLAFQNRTAIPQAMHLHGHHGRLLFNFDDGYDPFWIDTVLIHPGATSRLAFVADNPGRWALRSAFAELFDAGLGGWFEVM